MVETRDTRAQRVTLVMRGRVHDTRVLRGAKQPKNRVSFTYSFENESMKLRSAEKLVLFT